MMTQPKMVKVYTKVPGAVIRLGTYGEASNEVPAWVPEDVAIDLETRLGDEYRVERDQERRGVRVGKASAPASPKGASNSAQKE
jgi:hypothetical protein